MATEPAQVLSQQAVSSQLPNVSRDRPRSPQSRAIAAITVIIAIAAVAAIAAFLCQPPSPPISLNASAFEAVWRCGVNIRPTDHAMNAIANAAKYGASTCGSCVDCAHRTPIFASCCMTLLNDRMCMYVSSRMPKLTFVKSFRRCCVEVMAASTD